MGFLGPPLRDVMICLICSGLRIGLASENAVPPWSAVAAILFRRGLPGSSVASDPIGDGGSGLVGLGALPSLKDHSSSSVSDERSRFSDRGSMSFSLLVSV